MARYSYLVFFVISHLLFLSLAEEESKLNQLCPFSIHCGNLSPFNFPFTNQTHPECGLLVVDKCNETVQRIHMGKNGPSYNIKNIAQDGSITLEDPVLQNHLNRNSCESFKNFTLPRSLPFLSFSPISSILSLFKCTHKLDSNIPTFNLSCNGYFIYYNHPDDHLPSIVPPYCSLIQLPVNKTRESIGLFNMLTSVFSLEVNVTWDCYKCHFRRGQCQSDTKGNFQCHQTKECNDCHGKGGQCQSDSEGNFQCSNIRTAADAQKSNQARQRMLTVIIVPFVLGLLLLCLYCLYLGRKHAKRKGEKKRQRQREFLFLDSTTRFSDHEATPNAKTNAEYVTFFELNTLVAATDNFASTNKLGQGGFGPVFKGKLLNSQEIAVKKLSTTSGQGSLEFKNEVLLIAKLQHRNLVRLLGCCIEDNEKMLIYEFMPNKSLDYFIFDESRKLLLDWKKRTDIILGVARGVLYLHQDSRLRIIHRDLKASNILLDKEMNPRISDFGTARVFGGEQVSAKTRRVIGTFGYMSPEYALAGLFSMKSDVFSFGVLLLEIISGKRNTSLSSDDVSSNLTSYTWELWRNDKALEIVDASLANSFPAPEALRCIQVGLLCVQDRTTDRPSMSTVVFMLSNETILPSPKQPTFSVKRIETGDSSNGIKSSVNEVTVTTLNAR